MKKLCLLMLVLLSASSLSAQKYMTRTGKISFFSTTPVENIEAFNNEVACIVDSKSGEVVFQAPVKSFRFEKELMQEHFNEDYMQSDKYPKSDFKGKITNVSAVPFGKDGTYKANVTGKLTIHGISHDVSAPATITVKGNEVTAGSKFTVVLADYGIKIPSIMASKIAQKVEVTVNAVLHPL